MDKKTFDFNENIDYTCLGVNEIYPADFELNGNISLNELIIGGTGCGKTQSVVIPKLLHLQKASMIVALQKRVLADTFGEMLIDRGYEVGIIDMARPGRPERKESDKFKHWGYDPMDNVKSTSDVLELTKNIITNGSRGSEDPFWDNSAINGLGACVEGERLLSLKQKRPASLVRAIEFYRKIKVTYSGGRSASSADSFFDKLEETNPGNSASQLWKSVRGLSEKTASCVFSIINSAVDSLFTPEVMEVMKKRERVNIRELGEKRMVIFVLTSPVNSGLQRLTNLFYDDSFKILFECAEEKESYRLDVPVHICIDDCAGGSKLELPKYITIMRAAGISVSLCIQSWSMLNSFYNSQDATTITNNCDSLWYGGGMDNATNRMIAETLNLPFHKIRSMPVGKVVIIRRGQEAIFTERYNTYDDPIYREVMQKYCKDKTDKEP